MIQNPLICSFYMDMGVVKKVTLENSFDVGLTVFLASLCIFHKFSCF